MRRVLVAAVLLCVGGGTAGYCGAGRVGADEVEPGAVVAAAGMLVTLDFARSTGSAA